MADFVLKRKPGFRFKIEGYPEEGAEKVFTIPAPSQLSFEDVEKIRKLAETEDVRKHGAAMKSFCSLTAQNWKRRSTARWNI